MSILNRRRILNVNTVIEDWDDVLVNNTTGLTHTLPQLDDQSVKEAYHLYFVTDAVPMTLTTVDGTVFFETGNNLLTVTAAGLYRFELFNQKWYRLSSSSGAPGLTDITIIKHMYVSEDGNDGTAVPNSMVFRYNTIEAAWSATQPLDLVYIFAGNYILNAQMDMDGSRGYDFYCEPGVVIDIQDISPAINLFPVQKFRWKGWADFKLTQGDNLFWDQPDTASGISEVEFEFNTIKFDLENGAPGAQIFAMLYSQMGYIKGFMVKDYQFRAPGWQWYKIAIDKVHNQDLGISAFYFDDFQLNDGPNFVGTTSRIYISGNNSDKCEIWRGTEPGIYIESGGDAQWRVFEIRADLILSNSTGMELKSGTIHHWGNIESGLNDGGASTLTPCVKFTENIVDRWSMNYTHHEGIMKHTDNAVISGQKSGKFTFKGEYRNASVDSFALFEWTSNAGAIGIHLAFLYFDGIFRNDDNTQPIFRINENTAQDLIKQTFLTCIAQGTTGFLMENTVYGTPLDIFVVHSLVTNVLPNGTVTDLSTGNRWYTDTGLDMGL